MTEKLEITQAAREAAAAFGRKLGLLSYIVDDIIAGNCDSAPIVQAYTQSLADLKERCAKVCEETGYINAEYFATAIRSIDEGEAK